MTEIERQSRGILSSWQFWMGIAYFGLVAVVVGLAFVAVRTARTADEVSREQAIRNAQVRATADATYNSCLQSIPELTRISVHLGGVNQLAAAVVANAKALLLATPREDSTYALRFENYARVLNASKRIAAVQDLPIPTVAACKDRRAEALASGGLTR